MQSSFPYLIILNNLLVGLDDMAKVFISILMNLYQSILFSVYVGTD